MYFIDQLATYIHNQQYDLPQLTLVLPSQRAKKYLQRALFNIYQTPIFSPKIITMDAWIKHLSPAPIIDPTSALFKLYDVHLQVDKKEPQTIDEFLRWGRTLLSDFDELDRYLIDSQDLFKNLKDIKEIENWSFNTEEELTKGQLQFMRFWDLLKDYYAVFNQHLEKSDEFYMGKAYRYVAENIDVVFKENKETQFIFAGFNALSPAEISIMKQLRNMGKAELFVDGDEYYIKDKNHEAGKFIRELFEELKVKTLPFIGNRLLTQEKKIEVINCAQPTGQAKVVATVLEKIIAQKEEQSDTLLLLGDEKMIVPAMKNIPESVGETNITLGLPLKNTAIKSWVDLLFGVQEHFLQFRSKSIYHKDFIRFCKHPFIVGFCNEQEERELTNIEAKIMNGNWMFIYEKAIRELSSRLQEIIDLFFTPWKPHQQSESLVAIRKLNKVIFRGLTTQKNEIECAILYHFDQSILQLEEIVESNKHHVDSFQIGTFKMIFNQHWIHQSIAYYGNPLKGLQMMGLLETRLIDFKNIIVLGLNEGSMPPTNPIQTIIPMDLRKYHRLPTPREKQGLFAHHFYRLLHHAENVWITYSSANREMGGIDEPSRYIMQLELELTRANSNIKWSRKDYKVNSKDEETEQIVVAKSASVLQRMDDYFSRKTSATALKTAMRCPLDFYYKYLLGLGEEKKVEEDMEAGTFGSIIHETLEDFYQAYTHWDKEGKPNGNTKTINKTAIELMLSQLKPTLRKHFDKKFQTEHGIEGKNYLSLEIAEHLTRKFLLQEKKILADRGGHQIIMGTELKLSKTLQLEVFGQQKSIKIIGYIDRIDEFEGGKRIIDYKSGKCSENDVKLSIRSKNPTEDDLILALIRKVKSSRYALQLLIYNMLFQEKFGYYPEKVGVISFVNLKNSPFYLDNQLTDSTASLMELFEKALAVIIEDLYDNSTGFEHDSKSRYCDYCEG